MMHDFISVEGIWIGPLCGPEIGAASEDQRHDRDRPPQFSVPKFGAAQVNKAEQRHDDPNGGQIVTMLMGEFQCDDCRLQQMSGKEPEYPETYKGEFFS